jgi:hypothetical protein
MAKELCGLDWSTTQVSHEKKGNGLLHILHNVIVFLADVNYQVKTYAGPLFTLGWAPKATFKHHAQPPMLKA